MPRVYGAIRLGILEGFSMLDSGESIKTLLAVGCLSSFMNSLTIMTTLICKIPPHLPFPKGGITPLWQRGARGDFLANMSTQLWTP